MKDRSELSAKEWGRLRAVLGELTEAEALEKFRGRLSIALDNIARGRDPTNLRGAGTLSSSAVTTALRYCAQAKPPAGPGAVEELQG